MLLDGNAGDDSGNNPPADIQRPESNMKKPENNIQRPENSISRQESNASRLGDALSSKKGGETDRSSSCKSDQPPETTQKEEVASHTDSGRVSPSQGTASETLSQTSSQTSPTLSREESVEVTSGTNSRRQSSSGVFSPVSTATNGKELLPTSIYGELTPF